MTWQTKNLGELCDITTGSSNTVDAVVDGQYAFFDRSKIIKKSNRFLFDAEALIIPGEGAEFFPKSYAGKFDLHQRAYALLNFSNEANIKFVEYYLIFEHKYFERVAVGATAKSLRRRHFEELEIPLPPLSEQKRIVKILDEMFDGIAKAKESAKKNLQNSKELFESYLQSVFAKQSISWNEAKLGDKTIVQIIDGDRGKNYPKKNEFASVGYCLFLNTKNVRPDGFDFQTTMFVTQIKDEKLGNGKLKRGDVLLTTRGTIGNIAVYDESVPFENIRINSGMLIFRPNTTILLPEYLFAIFRSGVMKSQMNKYVSGAAQPQLPIKTLVNFKIPVPQLISEQISIVKKLDALSIETKKLEAIYTKKLAALEELKKSVLKKAFAGEL